MAFDGFAGDEQLLGDFANGPAPGGELGGPPFGGRQRFDPTAVVLVERWAAAFSSFASDLKPSFTMATAGVLVGGAVPHPRRSGDQYVLAAGSRQPGAAGPNQVVSASGSFGSVRSPAHAT